MAASRVERGTTLQGEYELLEHIAEHSGLVFRAQRRRDGAPVIVRVFAGLSDDDGARLLAFASQASRVRHPALASVSACGRNDGDVFVVEQRIDGRPLAELCERSGIPPLARSVDIALQLARGLESAHRVGVAHDALCPRNVLVQSAPGDAAALQVKLVDLGVPAFARAWPPALASALYMAPEQLAKLRIARSEGSATPIANVYSLGALLYDLCTGGPPFYASSVDELVEAHALATLMPPSRINPQIPSTLDTALLRALSRDPEQRFASMGELIEALSALRLSTGVSGVQPVLVHPDLAPPAPAQEGATFHGKFDERPTSKTELPPPRSQPPRPNVDEITQPGHPPARDLERSARASEPPRASKPPAGQPRRASSPPAARESLRVPTLRGPGGPQPVIRRSAPPLGSFSSAPPPERASLPPPPPVPRAHSSEPVVRSAASIELLRNTVPPHVRLREQLRAFVEQLEHARKSGERFLPVVLLSVCLISAVVIWQALRAPLPDEQVSTTSLAPAADATPTGAGRASERERDPFAAVARVEPPREPAAEPEAERAVPPSAEAESAQRARALRPVRHEPARVLRASEPRGVRSERADASAVSIAEAGGVHASSELPPPEADQPEPLTAVHAEHGAGAATEGSVLEPESTAPAPAAEPRATLKVQPSVTSVRSHEPSRAAAPSAPARPASAHVSQLVVRGSLPSSVVTQGIERVLPQLNGCFRSAQAAGSKPAQPLTLQVAFELDEQGRARSPHVRGAGTPALLACVSGAASRIASRRAPDTGTVAASFQLVFGP